MNSQAQIATTQEEKEEAKRRRNKVEEYKEKMKIEQMNKEK